MTVNELIANLQRFRQCFGGDVDVMIVDEESDNKGKALSDRITYAENHDEESGQNISICQLVQGAK
ncbi:hypothetical protein [Sutterella wadsworthensis]|uniref:hypothetical protein n=1 Tax=Sutterella wadsworthensis TaxID=40545 RepID=UPI00241DAEB6|nr:hypothetical protein [Sutterella wadsworthensis]